MERSFVMMKPDAVQRCIVGEILSRFERKGLKICALKMMVVDRPLAQKHYKEHAGKLFYEPLIRYITSSPVVAMVLEGEHAIASTRRLVGATKIEEALPGTIRGDLVIHTRSNVVHASDSKKSATREIALFFAPDEILSYEKDLERWVYYE
ncbi:MAG: nucleoside-diphosphate kinase [Spirochaetes bacterium]|nr:nucleoside-diphosphate kinase [Spirochaetota bacterium]